MPLYISQISGLKQECRRHVGVGIALIFDGRVPFIASKTMRNHVPDLSAITTGTDGVMAIKKLTNKEAKSLHLIIVWATNDIAKARHFITLDEKLPAFCDIQYNCSNEQRNSDHNIGKGIYRIRQQISYGRYNLLLHFSSPNADNNTSEIYICAKVTCSNSDSLDTNTIIHCCLFQMN